MCLAEHEPATRAALPRHRDPVTQSRQSQAALLLALASGEALLAVLFTGAVDRLLVGSDGVLMPLLAAGGIAAMAVAGWLAIVWAVEDAAPAPDTSGREIRA